MWGITGASVLTAAAAVGGAALTWYLARRKSRQERDRKAAGFIRGIDSEIDYAIDHAREYVNGKDGKCILSPAYRLPINFALEGVPWLASEGFLTSRDTGALLAHRTAAEEFNRCLDEVADRANERRREVAGRGADDADVEYQVAEVLKTSAAVGRAILKAENICTGDPEQGTAITARMVIRVAAVRAGLPLPD